MCQGRRQPVEVNRVWGFCHGRESNRLPPRSLIHFALEAILRVDSQLGVFLVIAGVIASPLLGYGAGDEEEAEQLGGLSYNNAYDGTTIRVDVFVRDREGNPVTGLTREQFHLFQDGTEVPIEHFTAFTQQAESDDHGAKPVAAGAPEAGDADERASLEGARPIYIVFFIDNQNLRVSDRNRLFRSLRAFLTSDLGGPAQIMIVSYLHSLEIEQPFTDDSRALVNTIRQMRTAEAGLDERDKERERIRRELQRVEKNKHHSAQGRNKEMSDVYTNIREYAEEEERYLEETLMAIRTAATALTGITDRKYLVYVSNGLPMALGAELLHQFAGLRTGVNQTGTIYKYSKLRHYNTLIAAINAQELTIHTIDATGSYSKAEQLGDSDSLRSASIAVIARENQQAPLKMLAEKTGGLAIINTDDFEAGLVRLRASLQTYYSIGYDVDSGSNGSDTVHHIEVKIDGDVGYETHYKRTYVEKSIQSRVQDEVTSGLFFEQSDNPMGLEVKAGRQLRATETQWQLPLTVLLPAKSLAMVREEGEGGEYVGRVVLFIAMRDLQGRNTDMQRQAHTFRLTADEYEQHKDDPFSIYLRLLLGSGHHRIVVGVLDEVTHQTSIQIMQIRGIDEGQTTEAHPSY
jgi:VWFA-related protein